jgi:hypothetical protein
MLIPLLGSIDRIPVGVTYKVRLPDKDASLDIWVTAQPVSANVAGVEKQLNPKRADSIVKAPKRDFIKPLLAQQAAF